MGTRRIVVVRASVFAALFLLMGRGAPVYAQHVNSLSATVDLAGGLDSNPGGNVIGTTSQANGFYSVYPMLSLNSRTARSSLNLAYAFGWNQFVSELPSNSTTHTVNLSWSREFSPRWDISLGESYSQSNDLQTFYALRGIEVLEEDVVFYFSPIATDQTVRTNSLNFSVNHVISPRSSLSLYANHSMGLYEDTSAGTGLSNQHTASGGLTYSRRISDRTSWQVGYTASRFGFDRFSGAISSAINVGMTHLVAKDMSLSLSVGPSHLKHAGGDGSNIGYSASASLSKAIERNSFHATYSQDHAMTTGLGSVSRGRRVSVGFSRTFNRRVNAFTDVSAFEGQALIGEPFDSRGMSATGNVGITLARNLSLHGGVQFQRYTEPAPYAVTQKRVFASLRYSHPDLLR